MYVNTTIDYSYGKVLPSIKLKNKYIFYIYIFMELYSEFRILNLLFFLRILSGQTTHGKLGNLLKIYEKLATEMLLIKQEKFNKPKEFSRSESNLLYEKNATVL